MSKASRAGELGIQPAKDFLRSAGVSQQSVAAMLGWSSDGQVRKILAGHVRPSPPVAAAIAAMAGRPVDECFTPAALRPAPRRPRRVRSSTFGRQPLLAHLANRGLSYARVAAAVGVSDSLVSRIANGQSRPSPEVAASIAALVGQPVSECFTPAALSPRGTTRRPRAEGAFGVQPARPILSARGLSDAAVATALGCSVTYVHAMLNGATRPSLTAAARLAQLVGQPVEACFMLDDITASTAAPLGPFGMQPLGTLLDVKGISPTSATRALDISLTFLDDVLSGRSRLSFAHAIVAARLVGHGIEECFTAHLLGLDTARAGGPEGTVERIERRRGNPARPGPAGVQPVKRLLADRHITHGAAASAVGCTQQHLTHVVNGQSPVSLVVAARLARLVGHAIDECFVVDAKTPTISLGSAGPYGRQPLWGLLAAVGTTASQTALTVGAGQVFVRRVLWGETRPSLELAALLARAAGRPIAQCFSDEMLGLAPARIVQSDPRT